MTEIRIKRVEFIPGSGVNIIGEEVEVLQLADGGTYDRVVKGYASPVGLGDFDTLEVGTAAISAKLEGLLGANLRDIVADAASKAAERDQAITARDAAIAEKEAKAAERNQVLAEKEATAAELESERAKLAELQFTLDERTAERDAKAAELEVEKGKNRK